MTTTYNRRRRRGPKAGSTAIPFMITILISLIVFGGVAFYFYNKLTSKSKELQPMQSAQTSISEDDVNSLLFVLDPDEDERKNAVMMMRFDPVRKKIFCVGVPLDLQVVYDGKSMTVDTCYVNHGMEAMKTAISELLDQPIDRYVKMDSNGFQRTVELIGNVTYRIPVRDTGLNPSRDNEDMEVTLDNEQFETMLTSSNYLDEVERCSVIGNSVAQLLNQCIGGGEVGTNTRETGGGGTRVAQSLDKYFSIFVNAVTTDITATDFSNHRHAISYMFQYSSAPATGWGVICNYNADGTPVPAPAFLENLKITFFQHALNGSVQESEESSETTE